MTDLRLEYPRPQFVRPDWLCLNGQWQFEIDFGCEGENRRYFERETLKDEITVPYCPESELSGIGYKGFMNCVWYRKEVTLPDSFKDKRTILHIGAIDYHAKLWVNGKYAASHKGGYTPFDADITDFIEGDHVTLTLCAYDDNRSGKQPSGKQSMLYQSHGCFYTRTTGIWQSVWLEPVDAAHILRFRAYPDITTPSVSLHLDLTEACLGAVLTVEASFDGKPMGRAVTTVNSRTADVCLSLTEAHLWDLGQGNLYDLTFKLTRGDHLLDVVEAYFGLRQVGLDRKGMTLNGRYVFGRFVLDQGFYPDGIYTAPSDEALRMDVVNSMKLGFNGARLHEKIFEPRLLYWADKLGYMVWGEHGNWGMSVLDAGSVMNFLPEWLEAVERDFSHPSIIGWCPFNETWDEGGNRQCDDVLRLVYLATKAADKTRPCIDTSGNFHVVTDIFDVHDYEQDPVKFASYYEKIASDGIIRDQIERGSPGRQVYNRKLPVFMSEYGGIRWVEGDNEGWGYGNSVTTKEEFFARYKGLTDAILDNPSFMGFCYTQLYDVEQEMNGCMTYDRKFKFEPELFYAINTRKAAIEE
ncbi:MAG: beta-galactosidase [Clostridia bacterium]|nr:beta-galactosidase [Clostridia bacterium]